MNELPYQIDGLKANSVTEAGLYSKELNLKYLTPHFSRLKHWR